MPRCFQERACNEREDGRTLTATVAMDELLIRIKAFKRAGDCQVRWCDERRLLEENEAGVSPGGDINLFGWWVIGTTVGGNAIVVRTDGAGVYFADHTWYTGSQIYFKDFSGDREWHSLPFDSDGVRRSLYRLAADDRECEKRIANGELDALLDSID